MITAEQLVVAAMVVCGAGALVTLACARNKTVAGWANLLFTAASAMLVVIAVAKVLMHGPAAHPQTVWMMPRAGFALRFHVDGLSSVFLLIAAVLTVPAAMYSIAYMGHYREYGVARYYPYFLLFVAAIYGIVTVTDMMWFFFLFWQLLTLPGFALIRYEHKNKENTRAATRYLLLMEIACVLIMVAATLLAPSRVATDPALVWDLDTIRAGLPTLLANQTHIAALAFALFLVGFGIKMGMWPFGQFWLPAAHPAAPSPVSALLSGVMIKTGVYGLIRCFLWLVPAEQTQLFPLPTWGLVISVLGTISLFVGTMQALKQDHTKRLLAFSSMGQIGYVVLAVGASMALMPTSGNASAALATLALMGALFHVINHALFKGLLFLDAGSMLHATGTQDLNWMGGLMKFMPLTGVTVLVASFAISGVPLFNGFVSKWLIYSAAIQGSASAKYLPLCAAVAILTSALTLACFIKFFGVSFLSRKSALVAAQVKSKGDLEVGWMMQAPQVALALACIALGLFPALGFGLVQRALAMSPGGFGGTLAAATPGVSDVSGLSTATGAVYAPLLVGVIVCALFWLASRLTRSAGAQRRTAEPWLCGYAREAECHHYVSRNFYGEIKRYFRWVGGVQTAPTRPGLKGQ